MIREIDFYSTYSGKINIALGYFDSLHYGHLDIIELCHDNSAELAVFTFDNNALSLLDKDSKQVFTYNERVVRMAELNVDIVIKVQFDSRFMHMSGEEFLSQLITRFNINRIVVGEDYKCGYKAIFNANDVSVYCATRGVNVDIVPLRVINGVKISSSKIRQYIKQGNITAINSLMPIEYSIMGKVKGGRGEGGRVLGFPTANIDFHKDKLPLKEGVYASQILIEGIRYNALTNVGCHPTFDDYNYNVESFILDFDSDIYDSEIIVYFTQYLRDTIKFSSIDQLKEQINNDIIRAKSCK